MNMVFNWHALSGNAHPTVVTPDRLAMARDTLSVLVGGTASALRSSQILIPVNDIRAVEVLIKMRVVRT